MRNRWTGLVLALATMAAAAPVRAQYLAAPGDSPATPTEPLPIDATYPGPGAPGMMAPGMMAPGMMAPGTPGMMAPGMMAPGTPGMMPPGMMAPAIAPPMTPAQGPGAFGYSSPNSLPADLPNSETVPGPPPEKNHFYVSAEYLRWYIRNDNLSQAIVTTSSQPNLATSFGQIGQAGTEIIAGSGGEHEGALNGVRATVGFAPDVLCPFEVTGFYLHGGNNNTLASSGSSTSQVLSRAVFATQPGVGSEVVYLSAFPGVAAGTVGIQEQSTLASVEVNAILWSLINNPDFTRWNVEWTVGGRYCALNESLNLGSTTTASAPGTTLNFLGTAFPEGYSTQVVDSFNAHNNYGGAQIGLRASYDLGPFTFEAKGNVGVGVNTEAVSIAGNSNLYSPQVSPEFPASTLVQAAKGGILALPSNSGVFTRTRVANVDEVTLTLGYAICQNLQASVGYNLFYWSNVIRPGDQVNRYVDTRQVPTDVNYTPGLAVINPPFTFTSTNFWAQGLTVSLALTF